MLNIEAKSWRLAHWYRIITKSGDDVPFIPNQVQKQVLDSPHKRKLILKARQLGMSTLAVLDILDDAIWNENHSAGIVSYSIEHAQHIFKRIIGHALKNLPPEVKSFVKIRTQSAREVSFENGSFLRVDTTLRGSTYRSMLISEFGKTCARSPLKAEEVVTGTLNALPADGKVIIESTGEGMDGYFANMCLEAEQRGNDNLTELDYQLLFFPWYEEEGYRLSQPVDYDIELLKYFEELEKEKGITLDKEQKKWYAMQVKLLGDKVKQEFPSTVQEAFLSRSDAYYFASHVETAFKENRCLYSNLYDPLEPVYVAMDIGVNDATVIVFFQLVHGEIRVIDSYYDQNKDIAFYARHLLHDKQYLYHTIYLPHDSTKRDPLDVINSVEREFRNLFSGTNTNFRVLPRTDKQKLISYAKNRFNRCVFNLNRTKQLLDNLGKYRKRWNESLGMYIEEPYHNECSDWADAFQYAMQAVGYIESGVDSNRYQEKHEKALASARRLI